MNESDTYRAFVLPKLYAVGWDDEGIAERPTFADGQIVVTGRLTRRRLGKRADYVLRCRPDMAVSRALLAP